MLFSLVISAPEKHSAAVCACHVCRPSDVNMTSLQPVVLISQWVHRNDKNPDDFLSDASTGGALEIWSTSLLLMAKVTFKGISVTFSKAIYSLQAAAGSHEHHAEHFGSFHLYLNTV